MSGLVELSREPEVWKCTLCFFVALVEELPKVGPLSCPICGSKDIFPALDGGWKELRPVSQPAGDTIEECSTGKGKP
jgi:hypothetical protein